MSVPDVCSMFSISVVPGFDSEEECGSIMLLCFIQLSFVSLTMLEECRGTENSQTAF